MRLLLDTHARDTSPHIESVRLGTTVATNALLERAGAPTLLVTSTGMHDALTIGYQERPDIFARAIRKPPPLYRRVVAVAERVDPAGHVLVPLDDAELRQELLQARSEERRVGKECRSRWAPDH